MWSLVGLRRRAFLQALALGGVALAGEGIGGWFRTARGLGPPLRAGGDDPEPPNETVAKLLKQCVGDRTIQRDHVTLDMPDMAEDGRIVPVVIESNLPISETQYIKSVYLFVDHNPDPLVAAYHFTAPLGPLALSTRIKMKRTSWIRAIVESSTGEVWADYKKVETTLNGCG
jgi:sulfur-oxidizing protein SoxY